MVSLFYSERGSVHTWWWERCN